MSDFRLLSEGLCPHGHGPLERRDGHGWCVECGVGWSRRHDTVTLHMDIDGGDSAGRAWDAICNRFHADDGGADEGGAG